MTKKLRRPFNPININYLADPFIEKEMVRGTFYDIFRTRKYAPGTLVRLTKRGLEGILKEISVRADVRQLQRTIEAEVSYGERALVRLAGHIWDKIEAQKGLEGKLYPKEYREVTATCINCETEVATGLFDPKIPVDSVEFVPEQTLYARNLVGTFPDRILTCNNCGEHEFLQEGTALTYVFRDVVADKNAELEKRVRAVIQGALKNLHGKFAGRTQQERYDLMEGYVVDGFNRMFKSVKKGTQVDYPKLYKLFWAVRRQNIDLDQLTWIDGDARRELQAQIVETIPLPYAVIRARVKRKERMYEKILQVLYDLRTSGARKKLKDLYGLRVILPEEKDCYALVPALKEIPEFQLAGEPDDKIKMPIKRGEGKYKSIDIYFNHRGMIFETQIKTHTMDREAETHPDLIHDNTYVPKIREAIRQIPYQIRAVVATVIGVRSQSLLK